MDKTVIMLGSYHFQRYTFRHSKVISLEMCDAFA